MMTPWLFGHGLSGPLHPVAHVFHNLIQGTCCRSSVFVLQTYVDRTISKASQHIDLRPKIRQDLGRLTGLAKYH
jgi:hypothetical protein